MFAYVPSFLLQYVDFWEINWKFPRGCTATARRAWAQVASGIGVGGSNASASPRHPPFPLSAFPSSLNQPSEARGQKGKIRKPWACLGVLHGLGTVFLEILFPHRREMVMSIPVVRHGSSIGSAVLNPRPLAVKGSGPPPVKEKLCF